MPLISFKIELKLKWVKYSVFSAAGNENVITNNYANNSFFTIKDTKLYVPVVTVSAKDSQKLSKLLSRGSERSVYWNKYITKIENKNTANEYKYLTERNFVGVNKLFVLVY